VARRPAWAAAQDRIRARAVTDAASPGPFATGHTRVGLAVGESVLQAVDQDPEVAVGEAALVARTPPILTERFSLDARVTGGAGEIGPRSASVNARMATSPEETSRGYRRRDRARPRTAETTWRSRG
jgi:hypothetical protein